MMLVKLSLLVQVVYPALDSKVRNVTKAYSVEHQDEVGMRGQASGASGLLSGLQLCPHGVYIVTCSQSNHEQ